MPDRTENLIVDSDLPEVVRTTELTRRFGSQTAVEGLELTLRRGDVLGFLGPNGAGKTTTIKLLLGLLKPSEGQVHLFGEPLAHDRARLLKRVGAMVEAPAFFPYLSGRDNLRVLAISARLDTRRCEQVLELTGMTQQGNRKFASYSVGMKQRLALAATLLRDPDLLILDEPTLGLDPDGQQAFRRLVPWLSGEGRTVFLSSHTLPEVQEVCTRVAILRDGRLAASGTVASLLGSSSAVEVRVGDQTAALAFLAGLSWVRSARTEGDWLVVETADGRTADVNAALAGAGIYALEVRLRERTLDAVYRQAVHGEAA